MKLAGALTERLDASAPHGASQPSDGLVSGPSAKHPNTLTFDAQAVELVEAIASRVVELLTAQAPVERQRRLLTAAELAVDLGVARSFVYEHANDLGAVRLGEGSKPRLRFDPEQARAALSCSVSKRSLGESASEGGRSAARSPRGRRRLPLGVPKPGSVLAIRGRERLG